MTIATFDELKTELAVFLNRADQTARLPTYIALAEAQMNAELDLRTIESTQSLSLTAGARTVTLPTGFREALNLWEVSTTGYSDPLRMVTPELLTVSLVNGVPVAWCVDGTNIAFDCPSDTARTYALRMLGGLALSDASPTNLILTNYPDLYLYQSLRHAAIRLRDADLLAAVRDEADAALRQAKFKEGRSKAKTTLSTEAGELLNTARRSGFNINTGA